MKNDWKFLNGISGGDRVNAQTRNRVLKTKAVIHTINSIFDDMVLARSVIIWRAMTLKDTRVVSKQMAESVKPRRSWTEDVDQLQDLRENSEGDIFKDSNLSYGALYRI